MIILEINDIHKSYNAIKALNGITLSVPQGSVFGILGPNGSGKTTLLSIILDILKADRGTYKWFENTASETYRKNIGTLLETPNFYHYLTAKGNLEITREISGRGPAKNDIETALKKVKLYDRRHSKFNTFSLGMKQRLAIGAAILGSPSVLVLDEPTNGLDPVGIAEIRELILELRDAGHTIIIASHLLDEVERICSHVAIIKNGKLLSCGPVNEVLANDDLVEIGSKNINLLQEVISKYPDLLHHRMEADKMIAGFPAGKADLEQINAFCASQGVILNHLALRKHRLEERFFELTGKE